MAYRTDQSQKKGVEPPHSIDAEQAVLGAMLRSDTALHQVVEMFDDPNIFYYPKHKLIFSAMLQLYKTSDPCDITTVTNILDLNGDLATIGGRVYLVDLAEHIVTTGNVEKYGEIVLEKYMLRKLIDTSTNIAHSCYELEEPVDALLDKAESAIFNISERRLRKSFTSIKDLIPATFQEIENLQSEDSNLVGTFTGYDDLDTMINGLHGGELIIVAGRPSMGKSAITMNMAEHIAVEHKKGVAVFSLEMSKEQLALRMLCGRARLSQQRLRAHGSGKQQKLRDEEWSRLSVAAGPLSEAPIFIDDSPTASALEIRAKSRRLKAQHDIGLIIIDYLQMMHSSGRYENRQQEMATISRSLKGLAKELSVPVIACSQLSRQVEQRGGEKRPQLADLRESGAIEQDADVVMFIYRPEHYLSHLEKTDPKFVEVAGKAEVIVAKQRNGPTGVVNLVFVKDYARFENKTPGYREIPPDAEPITDSPF